MIATPVLEGMKQTSQKGKNGEGNVICCAAHEIANIFHYSRQRQREELLFVLELVGNRDPVRKVLLGVWKN